MDPQAPTLVPEKPNFPEPPKPKDNHWITIASMAVFVLLSLAAVAFLYYQNQQLKSMLVTYQTQASPTPTATPDPTANWKTYTNKDYGFTFKYPAEWKIEENFDNKNVDPKFAYTPKGVLMLYIKDDKNKNIIYIHPELPTTCGVVTSSGSKTIGGINVDYCTYGQSSTRYSNFGIKELPNFTIETYYSFTTIDQILSTFRFLGASPSPTAKACTQEAKLCPDGSYVGRTGPNCEFAPCP